MRFASFITALSAIGGSAALGRRDEASESIPASKVATPKRFILEFPKGSNHAALKSEISARRGIKVLRTFDSEVFSGLSVESNTDNIDTLNALNAVSQVWPSKKLSLEAIIQSESFSEDASALPYNYHNMTGVDKLHEAGIFGKGAVVAVVDTGVAYDHPALGGGFGPGFKISGGYDFVGNSTWPFDGVKQPDNDPYDLMGHGTHVAGIVAGKSDLFVGVAPEATILAYKVFGTVDGTDEDTLIDAFLAAYAADADVITASVVGYGGWAADAWGVVASRLVENGVVVTIAAGNWGSSGPFFYGNGASGDLVLGVASVDSSPGPAPAFMATFTLDGVENATKVAFLPGTTPIPTTAINLEIVPLSGDLTIEDEACQPLPPTTRNFTGVIALVRQGGCDWADKQLNLQAFGAKNIIFFGNGGRLETPFAWSLSATALIEARAGEAIINTVKAGGRVTASFNVDPLNNFVGMYDSAGGKASYFSSWGGLYDLQLKPDIAAPGGNILSAYLNGGYRVMSGTSMSTPYVAGVAALYIGQNGGRKVNGPGFAKDLTAKIMSSGRTVVGTTLRGASIGFWASPIQVGNGIVDASKVLQYTTSLSYAKFALNDTHHFSRYHSVDVTNSAAKAVTYNFQVQDAAGYEMWLPYSPDVYASPRILSVEEFVAKKMVPEVKFPSGTFTVKPGETKKAEFIFKYPQGFSNLPVYGGKILITGSNGEVLSVPYFGIASDLKGDLKTQFKPDFPNIWSGPEWPNPNLDEHNNFNFNLSLASQNYPRVYAQYHWGVQDLRWDIFEAGWKERNWNTYPPVAGQNGYIGSVAFYAQSGEHGDHRWSFDPELDDANETVSFPLNNHFRTSPSVFTSEYWWLGKMANGSQIAPGNYTMRFAALLPFGVPQRSDNWDKVVHKFSVEPLE